MTLQLKSTKQLLGRAGERFLLFGMLIHSKEGKLCLEDLDGVVELDFSQLVRIFFRFYLLALTRTFWKLYELGPTERRAVYRGLICPRGGRLHRERYV